MQISTNTFQNFRQVKRHKFGVTNLIFLMIFGLSFSGAGILVFKSLQVDDSWARVQGRVVDASSRISDGSTLYAAVVEYEANGSKHKITSGSSSSAYPSIGSTREVAYDPARPNNAKVIEGKGMQALFLLFPAIGALSLILAPILFIRSMRRDSRIKQLQTKGQKLQGVLVDIKSTGGDNSNTYQIEVSATNAAGVVHNYVSDNLTGVAGLAMADFRSNPIPIDVYVDPGNPENYYVDISDIPNLTPERIAELIRSAAGRPQSVTGTTGEMPAQQPPVPPNIPPASQPTRTD